MIFILEIAARFCMARECLQNRHTLRRRQDVRMWHAGTPKDG